jgi:(2Fe-2S) ferredoxin
VHVCFGPNCTPRGGRELLSCFLRETLAAGIGDDVEVTATTCRGRCEWGPSVNVYPGPVLYGEVTPEDVSTIVRDHLANGQPVRRLFYSEIIKRTSRTQR